jgi:hypothetical protein
MSPLDLSDPQSSALAGPSSASTASSLHLFAMSDSDSTIRHRDTSDQDEENQKDNSNNADSPSDPPHITWKDRIAHFTWPWFACTMSTGALAVVIGNTPNQFNGLMTIGKIFFLLDIAMFAAFTLIIATRFFLAPYKFLASLHHPTESLFFGSYWVTIALLMNCVQIYGVPSTGPWLIKTLEVLFYMYCGTVLIVGVLQYYLLFQLERLSVNDAYVSSAIHFPPFARTDLMLVCRPGSSPYIRC